MSRAPARIELSSISTPPRKDAVALEDVSLTAHGGEVFCVLGGGGAGKTLLVDLIMGLTSRSLGRVAVCGHDPQIDPLRARRSITRPAANGALEGSMRVLSAMRFFAGLSRRVACTRDECLTALRMVGLPDRLLDERVHRLPPDRRLFLWMAIALLRDSEILVLDDPTRDLDTTAARELQAQLLEFRQRGLCVFVATSDVLFASQVSDHLAVMRRGRIWAQRAREHVLSLSLAQLYLDYIGEPSALPVASLER